MNVFNIMKTLVFFAVLGVPFWSDAAVFGDISRFQVLDTTKPHYRVIGQVGNFCTGTLIGPRHVLTAAHCIYTPEDGHAISETTFAPGRNGDQNPFGVYESEAIYVYPQWLNYRSSWADVAIIVLKESIGHTLGWVDYGFTTSGFSMNLLAGGYTQGGTIVGYPGDKPEGTMWLVACEFTIPTLYPLQISYGCDTMGGMSGSSLVVASRAAVGGDLILGVHTAGSATSNLGIPLWGGPQAFVEKILEIHP